MVVLSLMLLKLLKLVQSANPNPRLGNNFKIPIIYAGNKDAVSDIDKRLGDITDFNC